MEKSKKTKLFSCAVLVAILGALGYWVYANYLLSSLGTYTDNSGNKAALKNKVYYCTLSKPKPCDPSWNPVKSNNPENEIRARVAAIGYKAQVLNGTPYGKLDFSPLGQRKAESYAWKLYGDDWKGVSNHGNRSEVATAHKPDGPYPFQRNCRSMQNYFNTKVNWSDKVGFEGYENKEPEFFMDGAAMICFGGYWTERTPVRTSICKGYMRFDTTSSSRASYFAKSGWDRNVSVHERCSFNPPVSVD